MLYRIWKFLDGFFPIRLLLAHLKYNLLASLYWFILFGIVAEKIAANYGVPYLFLSPEYNGEVNWVSFLFMGIGLGGFTMAFHIYSYKIMGKVYPFISTLSRPFNKFVINNSIIPLAFCLFYIVKVSKFQRKEEMASLGDIFVFDIAFIAGFLLFILISFLYFLPTNKDLYKITGKKKATNEEEPIGSYFHKQNQWKPIKVQDEKRYLYLQSPFSMRVSRPVSHYDRLTLDRVFTQNYLNATIFEIVTIIAYFFLGFFKELPFFQLPAGMSIALLLTVILLLFSILVSWFRNWAYPILIVLFLGLNFLSNKSSFFRYDTYAYGMNYENSKLKKYAWKEIQKVNDDSLLNQQTKEEAQLILANWKAKTQQEKPKLVLTMTSGGGSRSAHWVFEVMNHLDSISNNSYSQYSHMITGASGGMIGAAYYRSLRLEEQLNEQFQWESATFRKNISSDLLNTLSLSASVNDIFFRVFKFDYNQQRYSKDRGYAFEYQLHENTAGILEKPLSYYKEFEKSSQIPRMIFSPTIVNDGRRVLISPHSVNFLTNREVLPGMLNAHESIDFQTYFKDNDAENVRFSSVLRMSATFPLILPMTTLPTHPEIEVMDAGIRDNYGAKITMEYLYKLKDWIRENTSGVVIVQIRDTKKVLDGERVKRFNFSDKLTLPFTAIAKNLMKTQDYDTEEMISLLGNNVDFPIDFVSFDLKENTKANISLSWHLTKNEKFFIKNAIHSPHNQESFVRFLTLVR